MDGWRATVVERRTARGGAPWDDGPADGPRTLVRTADGLTVAADGREVLCTGPDGRTRWSHACAGPPREAYASGGRLLVATDSPDYHPWGHLGPALLLDLGTGAVVAELRGEHGAALDGGRFLLGLAGYDVFDTWRHGPDGALEDAWRSFGHYVAGPGGDVRVVERTSPPDRPCRVVRLLPGGTVEEGPVLAGSQVPAPVVLPDGTLVVLDAGVLRAVDGTLHDAALARLLPHPAGEAWRFDGRRALDGDRIGVRIDERAREDRTRRTTHLWSVALRHDGRTAG
ncbi:hypothetical protein LO771_00055 [Streptacidiphilus sp. ASG 303]|uniref:hypothetical protein n=1 Tax=Streptacidiphilus sp. ASG 303 TaxID=2896847 RepID=UPI001E58DC1D|nr:hypothetical protein [Streptacidiphilus sp. ASG 303]MCD0480845.1 hypothetical protein [Streptacidiphilus sp. ASG 303]